MILDLKKTIKKENQEGILVVFEYDTTFSMTEFYVSILCYIHPLLCFQTNKNKSPPIPVGMLFHEKNIKNLILFLIIILYKLYYLNIYEQIHAFT